VRVAVAAEDPFVRSGLVSLLSGEAGLRPVVEAPTPNDARVAEASAELVLWDASGQGERPRALEGTPTLALVRDEEAALEAVRAGALGVLMRSADGERVIAALRAIAAGIAVLEPAFLRALSSARALPAEALTLTPRELEVLTLVAEGKSNKLVADRLGISEHTAKFHVNAILSKLGAETRTEAVVIAARRGWLML